MMVLLKGILLQQYSGQIYGYLAGTRIPPLLNERIKEAESCILPLSLKKCPEYCSRDSSKEHVLRGGVWLLYSYCRSALRNRSSSDNQSYDFGFRVVYAPARTP
jgi:formylglycine-generating enzyme required for sulfatase activity